VNIQIDHLPYFLPKQSISEIWIPFPDPQHGNEDGRMRLTSERFLDVYRYLLNPGALCHLKTDDDLLYEYTLEKLQQTHAEIVRFEPDLHNGSVSDHELIHIKTTYEKRYLDEGKKIKYIQFRLT